MVWLGGFFRLPETVNFDETKKRKNVLHDSEIPLLAMANPYVTCSLLNVDSVIRLS